MNKFLSALLIGLALGACTDGGSSGSNGSSGDPGSVDAGTSSGTVSSSSSSGMMSSGTQSGSGTSSASSSSGNVSGSGSGASSTSGNATSNGGTSGTGSTSGSASASSSTGGTSGSSGQAMGTLAVFTEGPAGGDLYVNGELYAPGIGNGTQPVPAGIAMSVELRCGDPADRKLPLYQDGLMVNEGQTVNFLDRDMNNPAKYPKNICGGWLAPGGTGFTLTAVKTETDYEKARGLWKYIGHPETILIVDGLQLYGLGDQGELLFDGYIESNGSAFHIRFIPDNLTITYTWQNDGPCQ